MATRALTLQARARCVNMSDATNALDQITALRRELKARFDDIELGFKSYDNTLSALQVMVGNVVAAEAQAIAAGATMPATAASASPSGPLPWQAVNVGKVTQRVVKPGPANHSDGRSRRGVTTKQLGYIDHLADEKFARVEGDVTTMLDASQVISQLQDLDDVPEANRDLSTVVAKITQAFEPVKDKLDYNVLRMIPDGRYAVTNDDSTQTVFMRVAKRKSSGSRPECRVVQYKSSDVWNDLQRYFPDGRVIGRNTVHGSTVADLLTQIMMDKAGCADRYGARFTECVNCGRELTDDKSRYYRLGSECIQNRHDLVDFVDTNFGEWTPGKASRD